MKLLLAAVFTSLVSATPAAKRAQPNIALDVAIPTSFPAVQNGATPYVTKAADKAKREEAIERRATLIVDIWEDANRGGRHEGLYTDSEFPTLRFSAIANCANNLTSPEMLYAAFLSLELLRLA